jgi:tetratricopeptide (TPR) repeat protein
LLTLVPDLRLAFPDLQPNPVLEAQTEQVRLFESAVSFFTQLQARKPLLIILEDAHWADGGTLFLLRHLARRARASQLRILLVLSYQEAELASNLPLHNLLSDIHRDRLAARIKLTRFDQDGTRLVLESMLKDSISSELVEAIHRETEGNLFFIEELVADLVENDLITRKDHTWVRAREEGMRLPQSVRATIQERIARLAETTQETLRLAAVIGHEFDFLTLMKSGDLSEDTLITALEDAVFHQIIQEAPGKGGESFVFQHGLFPSTLREGLSSLRRHRMHRRVAAAVAELHPENYAVLAHHLQAAGDTPAARENYLKAARYAARVVAYQDAIKLYSQALELFPPDSPEQFDLLIERFRIYSLLGEQASSKADAQTILELARVLRLPSRRCDGLICLAETYRIALPGQATVTAEEAASLARQINDPIREARAMLILGLSQRQRGNWVRAREVIETASEKFRNAGMLSETAASQHTLALVLSDMGEEDAAYETAMTALALSRQAGDRQQEATSLRRIAITLEAQGKYSEALPYAEAALRLHRELGDREQEVHALNVLALVHAHLRHSTQAEAFFIQAIETAEKNGFYTGMTPAISNMLELVYRPRGDLEAGMNFIISQVNRLEFLNDPYLMMDLSKNNFTVMSGFGLHQDILAITRNLMDQAAEVMADSEKSFLKITQSRAHIDLGQFQAGLQAVEDALNLIQNEPIPYLLVYSYLTRFMAYMKMGSGVFVNSAKTEIDKARAALLGHNIQNYVAEINGYEAILDLYQGDVTAALEKAESAYRQFARFPFPFPEINLPYSLALYANNRSQEAFLILSSVYEWIQIVANKTKNPNYRTYWLEFNLWNKNIIRFWHDAQSGKIPVVPLIT